MKFPTVLSVLALLFAGTASAQTAATPFLDYDLLEIRFIDVDVAGGDGLKLGGSYRLQNNWLIVGSLASVSFNGDVDATTLELGGGYVWPYRDDWDLVASVRYVNISGDIDDSGVIFEGGVRGLLTPQFEIRGSANHVTAGGSDTFLELGGDYYFTEQFAAGLTFEFAGDADVWTIGARWFFR